MFCSDSFQTITQFVGPIHTSKLVLQNTHTHLEMYLEMYLKMYLKTCTSKCTSKLVPQNILWNVLQKHTHTHTQIISQIMHHCTKCTNAPDLWCTWVGTFHKQIPFKKHLTWTYCTWYNRSQSDTSGLWPTLQLYYFLITILFLTQ